MPGRGERRNRAARALAADQPPPRALHIRTKRRHGANPGYDDTPVEAEWAAEARFARKRKSSAHRMNLRIPHGAETDEPMTRRPARRPRARPSGPTRRRIRLRGIERNRIADRTLRPVTRHPAERRLLRPRRAAPAQARCAMSVHGRPRRTEERGARRLTQRLGVSQARIRASYFPQKTTYAD